MPICLFDKCHSSHLRYQQNSYAQNNKNHKKPHPPQKKTKKNSFQDLSKTYVYFYMEKKAWKLAMTTLLFKIVTLGHWYHT